MSNIKLEAYVIGAKKYKEKDSIILLLTSDGIKQVFGRSYRSLKSKYHSLNNIFLKISVLGKESKSFKILDFDIMDYSLVNKYGYDEMLVVSNYINLIKQNEKNNQYIFEVFSYIINNFDLKYKDNYFVFLMASILKVNNVILNFSSCVSCKNKNNISTFSYYDGGLICHNCYTGQKMRNIQEIKDINTIFNGKIEGVKKLRIRLETKKEIENLLKESLGFYIKE